MQEGQDRAAMRRQSVEQIARRCAYRLTHRAGQPQRLMFGHFRLGWGNLNHLASFPAHLRGRFQIGATPEAERWDMFDNNIWISRQAARHARMAVLSPALLAAAPAQPARVRPFGRSIAGRRLVAVTPARTAGAGGYLSAAAPSTLAPVVPALPGWPAVAPSDPPGPSAVVRPKRPARLAQRDKWTRFAFRAVKAWRVTIVRFSRQASPRVGGRPE